MSLGDDRREHLLSMTLTELAFILFFLLLLLTSLILLRNQGDLEKMVDQARLAVVREEELRAALASANQTAAEWISEEPGRDDFIELVRNHKQLEEQLKVQNETATKLREQLEESELQRAATEKSLGPLEDKNARLEILIAKSNPEGFDFPPCWPRLRAAKNQPANAAAFSIRKWTAEYIYRVTIWNQAIDVEPAWPDTRTEEVLEIPGAGALIGDQIELFEFEEKSKVLKAWADSNECRHYVIIDDCTTEKPAYKHNMDLVETYFYKHLSDSKCRKTKRQIESISITH